MSGLSPINESSNSVSSPSDTEESIKTYDKLELDELFDALKKQSKSTKEDGSVNQIGLDDKFAKIRESIAKIPKIKDDDHSLAGSSNNSKTKAYLLSAKEDKKLSNANITNINDPIKITKKRDTKERGWFDLPKADLTESIKRDLKIIEQRAALDPKRHYKKSKWKAPENFQIGTIIEGTNEFYSSRLKNKDRHQTILESVLNDQDTKHYFKRKYDEIQVKKTSGKKGHYKKVKEARRKF